MDQFLFDVNPNPILIYEKGTLQILSANKSFQKKYEYSRDELTSLTIEDIRLADRKEELYKALENNNREPKSVHHQSKNGESFYVNLSSHDFNYEDKEARMVFIHDVTDRVIAENRAKSAFDELNHHVKESPLAMIKWDADFKVIKWSQRSREIMGYTEEQVIGKTPLFFRYKDAEDRAVVEQKIEEIKSAKTDKVVFNTRMLNNEGEVIYLRVHGSALRDEEGELVSVLTFMENITEVMKTKHKYQRLFENANDGFLLLSGEEFIECNKEILNIYGCSTKEEVLGKSLEQFSPDRQPDNQKSKVQARNKVNEALAGHPQVFEWQHQKKDGSLVSTEVSLNKMELGGEKYVQAIVRDLTEQKKAKEKIRRHEEMFHKLFLNAPSAMVMVDSENRVKMTNQSFEKLFGFKEEELLGRDIDAIIVPEGDSEVPRFPGKRFVEGRFFEDVIRYTKGGEAKDILLAAIPVILDGEPIAGFGIYIDMTERKENERKLQQSVKEKQVLLEEIHHRVKNNLAIISGFLQLQAFEIEDTKTKEVLSDSQLRIQSIAIVHEMLYQSDDFADISFETYVKRLIKTVEQTLPLDYQHIDIEISAPDVALDINQAIPCAILINELVTNAYKHAFKGRKTGKIWISLEQNADLINLEVRDDGVGLPDDFNISDQNSIGMNLIQTLTQQLDGNLSVDSKDGSSFKVCFQKTNRNEEHQLAEIAEEE
ncbi:PAS domain S-box protein [Fodinibius halophilus]|uniref:histidine kinase n=1 Tax=Fodinibius halophilus TaxID=1736908 RepID=A0A6M1T893_9BACT|nr:PAS domain S-box protein [Fodinibius halophilus]NGP88211.1 PAS domain S-box protein [Fodinibius halophilus]